jgi:tripartite-type tricarboxylate transporter receptor subunit TctC
MICKSGQNNRRKAIRLFIACMALSLVGHISVSRAQDYPDRAVRVVIPNVAGGSSDTIGRLVAQKLRERLGQPFIVDNRPGAGQMIGADHVAKSAADGYTVIFLGGTYTTSAAMQPKLPFDPVNDLTGVAIGGEGPFMLAVHPSLPVKSVKELIAVARSKPGQLNFASAGTGSITHLVTELFASMAKIRIVHVPYKAGAPAATDLVGGHVEMMIGSLPLLQHHAKAQRIRALAVTSARRSALAPELPTIAEVALPGYRTSQWWGMLAPTKTPRQPITRLNAEINKTLVTDEMRSRLGAEGAEPVTMSPEAFSAMIRNEIANWRKIVSQLKLQPE